MRSSPRLVAYCEVLTSTSSSRVLVIEFDIELQHVDAGLAHEAQPAAVGAVRDGLFDVVNADSAGLGHAVHLKVGVCGRDVRVEAAAAGGDRVRGHSRIRRGCAADWHD